MTSTVRLPSFAVELGRSHGVRPALDPLLVEVDSLRPYPGNAKQHADDELEASLVRHGQYRPVTARTDGTVLAGNGTWAAVRRLGWTHVARTLVDCDDDEAARIVAKDNRLQELAHYDPALLEAQLRGLSDTAEGLDGTGWAPADLDALAASIAQATDAGGLDPFVEWEGMPDYDSSRIVAAHRTVVSFGSAEDERAFFALLGRPRKARWWWPDDEGRDGHRGSNSEQAYVAADPDA